MKKALVIGASRGIGRQIALTLSKNGYNVAVAAKSTEESSILPGTIFSVSKEINDGGGKAIAIPCNARSEYDIRKTINNCMTTLGGLDLATYNAGAVMWNKVSETPLSKFDLMTSVNVRGAYVMIEELLPYFLKKNNGKFIMVSPPIYSRFFKGKTPYAVSKIGLSVLVQGLGLELQETGVSITSLWPAKGIKSHVTNVYNVEDKLLRTPEIFADACLKIAQDNSNRLNGQCLIDEDYLRSIGETDFTRYRCDPQHEPPRMVPSKFPSLRVAEEDDKPVFSKL